MRLRVAAVLLLAGMLQACMLTADRPLFAPADGDPAFIMKQGLWAVRDPDCKADPAKTSPRRKSCIEWLRVSHAQDGAWVMSDSAGEEEVRGVFVAAVAHEAGSLASVYAGEFLSEGDTEPAYVVVAPQAGPEGFVTRITYESVPCSVTDTPNPPIVGVALQRNEEGSVSGCKAETKEAVLEAARRAALDALPEFGRYRIEYVRP